MQRVFIAIGCLVILGALSCSGGRKSVTEQEVFFYSVDGLRLGATCFFPKQGDAPPPGVLLLHRYGGSRAVWEGFARTAQQSGFMVLSVDLRGHGDSRARGGETIHYAQLSEEAMRASIVDIEAARNTLVELGAHPDNLAVAGEGLGANLALQYALLTPKMQALVMVSPGLIYQGVGTEKEIQQLKDCPSLLIVGEGDTYAAMSARTLKAAAPVYAELRTWPGAAHGTDIFAAHPEAMHYVLQWLTRILKENTGK